MKFPLHLFLSSLLISFFACSSPNKTTDKKDTNHNTISETNDTVIKAEEVEIEIKEEIIDDTAFVNLYSLDTSFILDFRYADTLNFFKKKLYQCSECQLRYETAKALIAVNNKIKSEGKRLIVFDCYRPFSVQEYMWEIMPDSRYVANPNRGGSIHNRGGAVDVAFADSLGNILDFGTEFDHFGKEANHTYLDLNEEVLNNRNYLKSTMEEFGFIALNSEWWHYTFKNGKNYSIAKREFECKR